MIEFIHSFFRDYTLGVPFSALIIAIFLKGIVHAAKWHFSLANMLGSGGMPSAHSTFVVALSTAMGLKYSVWSDEFTMALVFSIVIIYDAMNVRYQSGLHAKALNKLNSHHEWEVFNESMGHTPIEALIWGIIGFTTSVLLLGI